MAARNGHLEVVRALLAAGANKDAPDKLGRTPLHTAAHHDHPEVVRALLNAGANKDGWSHEYQVLSDIYTACNEDRISGLKDLLWKAVPEEYKRLAYPRPLHAAAACGFKDAVEYLIRKDRAYHAEGTDQDGNLPIHLAAKEGRGPHSLDTLRFLVGALPASKINARNKAGRSPLHFACARKGVPVPEVLALLAAHADPNLTAQDGCTPLHEASRSGNHLVVVELLKRGADVSARTAVLQGDQSARQSALLLACMAGHQDAAKVLATCDLRLDRRALDKASRAAQNRGHADLAVLMVRYAEMRDKMSDEERTRGGADVLYISADLAARCSFEALVDAEAVPVPEQDAATRHDDAAPGVAPADGAGSGGGDGGSGATAITAAGTAFTLRLRAYALSSRLGGSTAVSGEGVRVLNEWAGECVRNYGADDEPWSGAFLEARVAEASGPALAAARALGCREYQLATLDAQVDRWLRLRSALRACRPGDEYLRADEYLVDWSPDSVRELCEHVGAADALHERELLPPDEFEALVEKLCASPLLRDTDPDPEVVRSLLKEANIQPRVEPP